MAEPDMANPTSDGIDARGIDTCDCSRFARVSRLSEARAELTFHGRIGPSRQGLMVSMYFVVFMAAATISSGCTPRISTLEIVDYRAGAQSRPFRESFDEAYYDFDALGNIDIVLRRSEPGEEDPSLAITQIVHVRAVWRSIPGNTVAHRTQINASVSYAIVHGGMRASFEGAGSVFFNESRDKTRISGALEQALLKPMRSSTGGASASDIFQCADVKGTFYAVRDHRRVVRIVNDMKRLFGPH